MTKAEKLARIKELDEQIKALEKQEAELKKRDFEKHAQGIIDKTFDEFKEGARWTNNMKKKAEKDYYVFSPAGRVRRLYAGLTGDKAIIARQVRRGSNAPIQGMASEFGTKSSRLIVEEYYDSLKSFQNDLFPERELRDMGITFNRIVHDASYYSVPYAMVIPFIHMMQWHATYGVADRIEKELGIKFTVEPEIEVEIGARDDKTYKWDWTLPNLVKCLDNAVADAEELNVLEGGYADVMNTTLEAYRNKRVRKRLQANWPLLGVKKLDHVIKTCERDYLKQIKTSEASNDRVAYKRFKKIVA